MSFDIKILACGCGFQYIMICVSSMRVEGNER